MVNYEIIDSPSNGKILKRTDEDGTIWFIPMVEGNSDYQAYLDRDKPKAALSTPIVEETN